MGSRSSVPRCVGSSHLISGDGNHSSICGTTRPYEAGGRDVHVASLPAGRARCQCPRVTESFFAIVFMGVALSLALTASFWRLAPGVSLALVGGIVGAIAGFVAWLFVPENLQGVDLLDGGLLKSFGNGLPGAARGFSIGLLLVGVVSFGLVRPPRGSPRYLRRAAFAFIGGGLGLTFFIRFLLTAACQPHPMDFCSDTSMLMVSFLFDAVVIATILLMLAPSGLDDASKPATMRPIPEGDLAGGVPRQSRTSPPGY